MKRAHYEELRQIEIGRAIGDLFRWRLSGAPLSLGVGALLVTFDPVLWRRITIGLAVVTMTVLSIWQRLRDRKIAKNEADLGLNLILIAVAQLAAVVATGGLLSPLLPSVYVITLLMAMFLPARRLITGAAIQGACIFALTIAQVASPFARVPLLGDAAPEPYAAALRGGVSLLFVFGVSMIGHRSRAAFEAIALRSIKARDEVLASYEDETRAVTTLAGEIAHELKNPLATVKSLAQIVAKDLDGKPAERLSVLRREVDRMQGILEEFLNFSRPLVPLALLETDLADLCRDVALLHEATARERGVSVVVDADDRANVRCDPRKVKQILVNLIQNAIAASPDGAAITITARADEEGASIVVRDLGQGLPEGVDVFAPGVTTKPGGSGLGLTIARGIARQHGGDLTIASAPSGCSATLVLPAIERAKEAA